jgi:hypothetical protein
MESKNKGVWFFVVVVVIALALMSCCLVAAAGAIGVPRIVRSVIPESAHWPVWIDLTGVERTERIEKTFEVGSAPKLTISNFAGSVTIRPGDGGTVRVVATKKAKGTGDLDAIVVQMGGQASGVEITTSHPTLPSISDASVDVEITVPADTMIDLRTGAGSIDVHDVQGALQVEAGAGSIEIRGAAGAVSVTTGAGSIDYEGNPAGGCIFHAGVGGIMLRLPADANLTVDLSAGLGGAHSELPVSGTVTMRLVRGTIGTGSQGSITASAGVGSIDLVRR